MVKSDKVQNRKIVVGMSGGLDSSMSLVLLKKQGWQPVGVSLKLPVWKSQKNLLRENICCTTESLNIARKICKRLNVPYYIFDVRRDFQEEVINYFTSELKNNKTPNPCIVCNRKVKFKKLFEWAYQHQIKYVATGHYVKKRKNQKTDKYELLMAKDKNKDQSYALSALPQKWLKYIFFPLGNYTKAEIYQMAKKEGFDFFLKRKQSQDFCFVSGKCLNYFLEKEIGKKTGLIKDSQGNVLGKHKGLHFYTIGQRKGIGLSGGPWYVMDKDFKKNILVVTKKKKDLEKKELFCKDVNWISGKEPKLPLKVKAKIRYRQKLTLATVYKLKTKNYKLVFSKSQRAITSGQSVVFYKGQELLGGGIII